MANLLKVALDYLVLCCVRILGSLSGYWATKELCRNANFTRYTNVKTNNVLSSCYKLNGLSQGQISEFLRQRKES